MQTVSLYIMCSTVTWLALNYKTATANANVDITTCIAPTSNHFDSVCYNAFSVLFEVVS